MADPDSASPHDVAERLGVELSDLQHWESLGLIRQRPAGGFDTEHIERARLVRFAVQRGISPSRVQEVDQQEDGLLEEFVDQIGAPRPLGTHPAAAVSAAGVERGFAERVLTAAALSAEAELFEHDVDILQASDQAVRLGLPESALVQIIRVYTDALTRVAEAETRLFHFYVHEGLRASGASGQALKRATHAISGPLRAMIEPTLLYFHRKAWERALREDLILHLAPDVDASASDVAAVSLAVLFVDLAGFTPLTEMKGDAAAADILDQFSTLVRTAAANFDGRLIKQIGDEFMLVLPSARAAVEFGATVVTEAAAADRLPPLRIGAHAGTALFREGDYVGATVNIAARVTTHADAGEFLVTEVLRQRCGDIEAVEFEQVGTGRFEGVADGQALHRVHASARL